MGSQAPIFRVDALRRMVTEWTDKGCSVVIEPDGRIVVTPPTHQNHDPFDLVDMKRK